MAKLDDVFTCLWPKKGLTKRMGDCVCVFCFKYVGSIFVYVRVYVCVCVVCVCIRCWIVDVLYAYCLLLYEIYNIEYLE